jgi:hypothetical protein
LCYKNFIRFPNESNKKKRILIKNKLIFYQLIYTNYVFSMRKYNTNKNNNNNKTKKCQRSVGKEQCMLINKAPLL